MRWEPAFLEAELPGAWVIYDRSDTKDDAKPLLNTVAASPGAPLYTLVGLHLAPEGPKGKALAMGSSEGMHPEHRVGGRESPRESGRPRVEVMGGQQPCMETQS